MAPHYVDRGVDIDEEVATRLIELADDEPRKPWTLAAVVAEEVEKDGDRMLEAVRHLTFEGDLTPTADGDLRATKQGLNNHKY